MITLKQLDALVWTVRLGTLSQAANRLNTVQPTISKRLQELEADLGFAVLERSGRTVCPTGKGLKLFALAEQMLALADEAAQLSGTKAAHRIKVALGMTELASHTWLPDMVEHVRQSHPNIDLHLTIGHSTMLQEGLRAGTLDIVFCPSFRHGAQLASVFVQRVEMALVCSPLIANGDRVIDGEALSRLTLLSHGPQGALPETTDWMNDLDFQPQQQITVDSLVGLIGMATAGMGVTILPKVSFSRLIENGRLIELKPVKRLPISTYRCFTRTSDKSGAVGALARSIIPLCNYEKSYETGLK